MAAIMLILKDFNNDCVHFKNGNYSDVISHLLTATFNFIHRHSHVATGGWREATWDKASHSYFR